MTTITIDRAVVEQALEALMDSQPLVQHAYDTDWRKGLPTRQAQRDVMAKDLQNHNESIAALRAALDAPQPEPVLYWHKRGDFANEEFIEPEAVNAHCPDCTPLYTTPTQREPLTDEVLEEIWENDDTDASDLHSFYYLKLIARAIEAAHGIGGKP